MKCSRKFTINKNCQYRLAINILNRIHNKGINILISAKIYLAIMLVIAASTNVLLDQ